MTRLRLALAGLLRRMAARLDPPRRAPVVVITSSDPEGDAADRRILELYLRRALRRYHPEEVTPQA